MDERSFFLLLPRIKKEKRRRKNWRKMVATGEGDGKGLEGFCRSSPSPPNSLVLLLRKLFSALSLRTKKARASSSSSSSFFGCNGGRNQFVISHSIAQNEALLPSPPQLAKQQAHSAEDAFRKKEQGKTPRIIVRFCAIRVFFASRNAVA